MGAGVGSGVGLAGYPDSEILDRILQGSPVTVLKKPLKIEQLLSDGQASRAQPPKQEFEQQSSSLLVGVVTWPLR
jgi:hypothetical protein